MCLLSLKTRRLEFNFVYRVFTVTEDFLVLYRDGCSVEILAVVVLVSGRVGDHIFGPPEQDGFNGAGVRQVGVLQVVAGRKTLLLEELVEQGLGGFEFRGRLPP